MVYISLVYITLKNVDPVYIIVLQKHTLGGFTLGSENNHSEGGSEGFFRFCRECSTYATKKRVVRIDLMIPTTVNIIKRSSYKYVFE